MKRRVLYTAVLLAFGAGGGMAMGPPDISEQTPGDPVWVREVIPDREVERRPDTLTENIPDVTLQTTGTATDTIKKKGFFNKIIDYFRESNEDKTFEKRFDFSIIGGPHYSSDTELGIGLVAAGLFRLDRTDSITPPSNVSLYGDIATTGFYLIGIRGNTFFRHAKFRLDYKTFFFSMPSDFWGLGYKMARNNANKSGYERKQAAVKLDFMYGLSRSFYVGTTLDFNFIRGADFERPELLNGQKQKYTNTGLGLFLMHDSRDVVTAPYKGWFFKLENIYYPKFMGNSMCFNSLEVTLDYYHPLWKGAVMAYDFHGQFNSGDVPWTMLARMGGSNRMRGYYEGRYRDEGLLEIQAELRQRIWRRIGVTTWVGAGNVFPKIPDMKLSHTLPNYGFGFRWEFKNRVNVRLDYGFGKGQSGFIFNINEAF